MEMTILNWVLERREDGWRIQLELEDGTLFEQEQEPFDTREEAEAALQTFLRQSGLGKWAVGTH